MRTAIALLLGAWMVGTVVVGGVAAENFFLIDRLLPPTSSIPSNAAFQKDVAQLPPGEARQMLRYLSSELNRFYFNVWGWMELVFGTLALALAVKGLKQRKFTIGFSILLALTAVMTLYITPRIIVVGRSLDYVPRVPAPPGLAEFGMLHGAYSILDLLKLLAGIWMAVALVRGERNEAR